MTEVSAPVRRDESAVRSTIRELIRELSPANVVESVQPQQKLIEDLSYHSLALMELAFTLEDEFGLEPIDEQSVLKIINVEDVENHVITELRHKNLCD